MNQAELSDYRLGWSPLLLEAKWELNLNTAARYYSELQKLIELF